MLSQSELEQAVIGAKDVPGWKTGTVVGRGGDGLRIAPTIVDVSKVPRITPAGCEPLYDMTQILSRYQYRAVVEQMVTPASEKDGKSFEMSLMSYSVADAPKAIEDLRTSPRTCSSFDSLDPGTSWVDPEPLIDPQLGDVRPVHVGHEQAHLLPPRHMKRSNTSLFGMISQHHRA